MWYALNKLTIAVILYLMWGLYDLPIKSWHAWIAKKWARPKKGVVALKKLEQCPQSFQIVWSAWSCRQITVKNEIQRVWDRKISQKMANFTKKANFDDFTLILQKRTLIFMKFQNVGSNLIVGLYTSGILKGLWTISKILFDRPRPFSATPTF